MLQIISTRSARASLAQLLPRARPLPANRGSDRRPHIGDTAGATAPKPQPAQASALWASAEHRLPLTSPSELTTTSEELGHGPKRDDPLRLVVNKAYEIPPDELTDLSGQTVTVRFVAANHS